jgi:DNA processing protein
VSSSQATDASPTNTAIADRERERDAFLRLNMVPGIGPVTLTKLLEVFETCQRVIAADPDQLRNVLGIGPNLAREISLASDIDIESQLEICRQHDIRIIVRGDAEYPKSLTQIHSPPNVLFVQGELLERDAISISIVGSRHATQYGRRTAERLGRELASAGFTIVSGMARGIDIAAHRGALQADGRTFAVFGSGLLFIYPQEHAAEAIEIRNHGALVSEFLPFHPPKSGSFPQRNRIIAGLSLGTIVVEAAQQSGALISARLAMEQGREVFAVPGPVDSRMSRGCHQLIRDGACLVESIEDVIQELGPLVQPMRGGSNEPIHHPAELMLNEQETLVLRAIQTVPTEIDEIVVQTGLPVARVLSTISVLEIRRLVRRISGTSLARL